MKEYTKEMSIHVFNCLVPCFVVIIGELLRKAGSKIFCNMLEMVFHGHESFILAMKYYLAFFLGQLVQNSCLGKSLG